MNTSALLEFIAERELIRRRRAAGDPAPWTNNPVLREWSFTNVRREDDRVTRWIATNWREPNAEDPDLWFAMCLARFVNWPDTLTELGYPVPWNREHFLAVMATRAARGDKLYGSAYRIHADNKHKGRCTAEYQATDVFKPLWQWRLFLRPTHGGTLARYCARLGECHGLRGGFMPAQIIADLKYVAPLNTASDWMTFAASGPGSRRGLNRVLGRPVDAPWSESGWRREFECLRTVFMPDLERFGLGDLHAQDLQNCLCEFDKHQRVLLGEGKPRRRFQPSHEPLPGITDTVTVAA
jgi:hypothetical protein